MCLKVCIPKSCWICSRTRGSRWRWSWRIRRAGRYGDLRDIIEHLVGDLPSYDEEFKQEIVEREDGSWLVDGLLPISEFKDFLDLDELPLEEKTGFNTVAGFVVTNIGHIPTAGNYFLWNGYRFEVVDMDGTRIDKILVEKTAGSGSCRDRYKGPIKRIIKPRPLAGALILYRRCF